MQFEASSPYPNTDRILETRGLENSSNLFLQINFSDLPKQHGKDSAAQFLPQLDLTHLDSNQQIVEGANVKESTNAREQLPALMQKLAKLDPKERDGLTREDLEKLEKSKDLTKDERAAVRYMKENYDKLNTSRSIDTSGPAGWLSWNLGHDRITPLSLERNSQPAEPAAPSEKRPSQRTSFGDSEKEVGDDKRYVPQGDLRGEKKTWNHGGRL